jgi:hypothetical protein
VQKNSLSESLKPHFGQPLVTSSRRTRAAVGSGPYLLQCGKAVSASALAGFRCDMRRQRPDGQSARKTSRKWVSVEANPGRPLERLEACSDARARDFRSLRGRVAVRLPLLTRISASFALLACRRKIDNLAKKEGSSMRNQLDRGRVHRGHRVRLCQRRTGRSSHCSRPLKCSRRT